MQTQVETLKVEKKPRIVFIDMARSIAILLMLEGHFVDDSLMPIYRDLNNPIYATWLFIRGFTGPIFLTVTGIVFVYLLLGKRDEPYFQNIRIKKGFKRVVELLFWGYILQYYAFHVLQCIGVGIFTILLIFGIYKIIKIIPLWIYYFIAGTILFGLNLYFDQLPLYEVWPKNGPYFIQNMFHGPANRAIYPLVPWLGYTMYGAMLGCLLHDLKKHVKTWYAPVVTGAIGATLFLFPKELLEGLDALIGSPFTLNLGILDWLYMRFGMVLLVLSVLMAIEKMIGDVKPNLFIKVGQNTLTIYIVHMILLYGSITGLGLNRIFRHNLGPWQVTIAAALFIVFFLVFIKYLDQIKAKLEFILGPIRRFFNKLYNLPG
ncbi:MAG TPA: heparan-alpha-glucosaminide N-acetyltransferase domain-containing protein [Taishania sp.]|nr:heparan-alpha-glucosaminide N-acetyltransferase domain-containing protein [Taishania sp.]HNS42111.1 heparan-alpha-glucosaminide N-acetyltransferase domain-containing protein [Taishania sp.]